MSDVPLAYFITFTCYGARLPGNLAGSVDRIHNRPGDAYLPASHRRVEANEMAMRQSPYELDEVRRNLVLSAMIEVCSHRSWTLFAAHVRTNHVHAVVAATPKPEKVMNDWKIYASRKLNQAGVDPHLRERWTRHGSTRYLWAESVVEEKIQYVLYEQGEPMAVYRRPEA